MISRAFAVVFSRMSFRIRCSVLQVFLPEVYDTTAEVNGPTLLQHLFEDIQFCQTIHMAERTSNLKKNKLRRQ